MVLASEDRLTLAKKEATAASGRGCPLMFRGRHAAATIEEFQCVKKTDPAAFWVSLRPVIGLPFQAHA
jgi:hypothetical protein